MKKVILKYYLFLPLLFLCFFYEYKSLWFPIHDFNNYYFGGAFLEDGNFNFKMYFPYEFNKAIANAGYLNVFASYAPNTPFLALLFAPFSLLPIAIAKLIFNSISTLLFVYSLKKLADFYEIEPVYLLLIPILFFIPIKNEILFGQVYFLLFFLLSECLIAFEENKHKKMAAYLSLSIAIKIFPILFILYFLFRRQLQPILHTVLFTTFFVLITLPFVSIDTWIFYVEHVLSKASKGEITAAFVDNYQSMLMFLKRCFVFDATENPNVLSESIMLFSGFLMAFKIAVIALGYYLSTRVSNKLFVFSYWIVSMIALSPYGSTYTFILLLFSFIFIVKSNIPIWKKTSFFMLLFGINSVPISSIILEPFPFSYLRLFLVMLFFIAFIGFEYQKINFKITTLVCGLLSLVFSITDKENNIESTLVLDKSPLLVYNYTISKTKLTYFYWDEKGSHSQSFLLKNSSLEQLTLQKNQIFFKHKPITSDQSNKLKPMLIDDSMILYLSDSKRGIGFFTLRKIELN
jgi:hypothetical protein